MNIIIVRNTTQTLSFTATGDYSGDTVKFTVKADKTLTSSRLIDKDASVSYSSPVSTITVSLLPTDSASLGSDYYYFDLRVENSTTDKEVIESGIVYVDKSVRNTTDGLTTELTEFTVSEVDPDASIPVVSMFYGYEFSPPQGWAVSSEGGCGIGERSFADGIISIAHDFSNTSAVVKRLDDTYNYEITSDADELLQITVTDSEDALLSALDANVKFLVNFNVAGL